MLGQWKVADKSNEITAVPELLRVLELAGCIVTVDAMECQKTIAKEIKEADADYLMALKGNQEAVYDEVKAFLDAAVSEQSAPRPVARNSRWARAVRGHWGVENKVHWVLDVWFREGQSRAHRIRRRESGHAAATRPESIKTCVHQKTPHQSRTTQRRLESRLPPKTPRRPNLDAFALA